MTEEETVRTRHLARMGSIFTLLLVVVTCSNTTTPSPTASTGPTATAPASASPGPTALPTPTPTTAPTASPSPTPTATPVPTPSPTASPRPSPRPMARATLKRGPKMLQARQDQMAVRLRDGRVLIMGGLVPILSNCKRTMGCYEPDTASVEVYDPKSGKFHSAGALVQPLDGASAFLLHDGRVLVYGGDVGSDMPDVMEIYNPATKTSAGVKPPSGLQIPLDAAVAELADGRVLIAGGWDGFAMSNVTLIFDPASGTFSNGPLLAEARRGATATLLQDGRVLIVGGYNGDYLVYHDAEVIHPLDPLSKSTLISFSKVAFGGSTVDGDLESTILMDGRVLVTGGSCDDSYVGECSPTTPEVFDPRTGRFALTGPTATPRDGSTVVSLPDGRALVFGGLDAKGAGVGTIEAFDPDSDTFQVVAKGFADDFSDFSATLLGDGRVLIAGGYVDQAPLAETWLIKP
jgi:large repetitive protein